MLLSRILISEVEHRLGLFCASGKDSPATLSWGWQVWGGREFAACLGPQSLLIPTANGGGCTWDASVTLLSSRETLHSRDSLHWRGRNAGKPSAKGHCWPAGLMKGQKIVYPVCRSQILSVTAPSKAVSIDEWMQQKERLIWERRSKGKFITRPLTSASRSQRAAKSGTAASEAGPRGEGFPIAGRGEQRTGSVLERFSPVTLNYRSPF